MNDEKQEKNRALISSILAGAGAGILMAALILLMLGTENYQMWTVSFFLVAACAAALPVCLNFLRYRGIPYGISELVMIGVSLMTCLLYAHAVSENSITVSRLTACVFVTHGISLIFNLIRLILNQKRKEDLS